MNNLINKLPKLAMYVLFGITIVVGLLFYMGSEVSETYNNIEYSAPTSTNAIMIWTYILVFLALGITLAFIIYNFVISAMKDGKSAIKPLIVLGGAILLFVIAYAIGDGTPLNIPGYDGTDNVYSWLKLTDMFLIVTYILVIVAFALIIYSNVAKFFKK